MRAKQKIVHGRGPSNRNLGILLPQKIRSFKIFGKDGNHYHDIHNIYIFRVFKPVTVFFCDSARRKYVAGSFKICIIYFCSWMSNIHELSRQSDVGRWRSLTHSILINLFIKPGLNNFLLPPLLSIIFCFQERTLLLLYMHALRYIVPLLLYCTKLGYFFLQLTKGALFQDGGITRLIRTGISNIN